MVDFNQGDLSGATRDVESVLKCKTYSNVTTRSLGTDVWLLALTWWSLELLTRRNRGAIPIIFFEQNKAELIS